MDLDTPAPAPASPAEVARALRRMRIVYDDPAAFWPGIVAADPFGRETRSILARHVSRWAPLAALARIAIDQEPTTERALILDRAARAHLAAQLGEDWHRAVADGPALCHALDRAIAGLPQS